MATKPYSAFLPEVTPHAPGAPEIVALNAIRNSAIEFCSTSLVWNEMQDVMNVTASDFPMDFSAPSGARVDTVLSVKVDGQGLVPAAIAVLDTTPGWEDRVGIPTNYYQPTSDQLALTPAPSGTAALRVRAAYTPTRASTGVEGFLYENYLEAIAGGALWRLMSQPNKPYTDVTAAQIYKAVFDSGVRRAAVDAQKGFATTELRVTSGGRR